MNVNIDHGFRFITHKTGRIQCISSCHPPSTLTGRKILPRTWHSKASTWRVDFIAVLCENRALLQKIIDLFEVLIVQCYVSWLNLSSKLDHDFFIIIYFKANFFRYFGELLLRAPFWSCQVIYIIRIGIGHTKVYYSDPLAAMLYNVEASPLRCFILSVYWNILLFRVVTFLGR